MYELQVSVSTTDEEFARAQACALASFACRLEERADELTGREAREARSEIEQAWSDAHALWASAVLGCEAELAAESVLAASEYADDCEESEDEAPTRRTRPRNA